MFQQTKKHEKGKNLKMRNISPINIITKESPKETKVPDLTDFAEQHQRLRNKLSHLQEKFTGETTRRNVLEASYRSGLNSGNIINVETPGLKSEAIVAHARETTLEIALKDADKRLENERQHFQRSQNLLREELGILERRHAEDL
jgi:hypothetical protein